MTRLVFSAVKKPAGSKRLQGINITFGESTLHFRPQALGASDIQEPELFMSSVNKFLDNFSDEDHKALFGVYESIRDVRDMPRITNEDIFTIDDCMTRFFEIVTEERMTAWGRDNMDYAIAPSTDSISPMRDGSVSNSCTAEEYRAICTLSTLFKMLIPFQEITGHVEDYQPNLVSNYWTLFALLNRAGRIDEYPAYQQLIGKAAAKAERILGAGVPTGLTAQGVGEDDFYKIILIPKLFRDLTRLETELATFASGTNNNVSYKINLAIENHIKNDIAPTHAFNISSGPVSTDEEGGNTTRQEAKAGGERFSSIYGIFFTRDYEELIDLVDKSEEFPSHMKMDKVEVMDRVAKYGHKTRIAKAQDIIAGTIFHSVIPIDATSYRPPSVGIIMMAYVSLIAEKLNLPNIRTLMLCTENKEGQFTESESRNAVQRNPIVHPKHQAVLDLYPTTEGGHPFTVTVDNIVRYTTRTNYVVEVAHENFELGAEWFPTMINDQGFKDEMVELLAQIHGV